MPIPGERHPIPFGPARSTGPWLSVAARARGDSDPAGLLLVRLAAGFLVPFHAKASLFFGDGGDPHTVLDVSTMRYLGNVGIVVA
ncbi:MAG: hypothetical protein JW751_16385 [Polyangiaceae bacterium]|nr:hypothetical protein [Polyangiaceae bacterium]